MGRQPPLFWAQQTSDCSSLLNEDLLSISPASAGDSKSLPVRSVSESLTDGCVMRRKGWRRSHDEQEHILTEAV